MRLSILCLVALSGSGSVLAGDVEPAEKTQPPPSARVDLTKNEYREIVRYEMAVERTARSHAALKQQEAAYIRSLAESYGLSNETHIFDVEEGAFLPIEVEEEEGEADGEEAEKE